MSTSYYVVDKQLHERSFLTRTPFFPPFVRMLATFVEQTKPKAVNVTYLLSGIEEKENGVKVNIVTLVSDDNLKSK